MPKHIDICPISFDVHQTDQRAPKRRVMEGSQQVGEVTKINNKQQIITPEGRHVCRKEAVRVIVQSLSDLGYEKSASLLEQESGFCIEEDTVRNFREAASRGDWTTVLGLLPHLHFQDSNSLESAAFIVLEQQFLELVEQGKHYEAVKLLQENSCRFNSDSQRCVLHHLSSLIMFTNRNEILSVTNWNGANDDSRRMVVSQIQSLTNQKKFLQDSRLLRLIDDAANYQISQCLYHNTVAHDVSLLETHQCSDENLPVCCSQILSNHTDEVWFVQFSHDGRHLASASKDRSAILWNIDEANASIAHILNGHRSELSFLCWSPNDEYIVVAGSNSNVKLWNTRTGENLCTITGSSDQVMACGWTADSLSFITAGTEEAVLFWDLTGGFVRKFDCPMVDDIQISSDGNRLFLLGTDRSLHVYDLNNDSKLFSMSENFVTTSFSLSRDGRFALLNISKPSEVHLWSLKDKRIVQKFYGAKQGRYIVRSSLGGIGDTFVISGSEDSLIYLWRRESSELLATLSGHTGSVNCVSWSPVDPTLFASASDDKTVRLWTSATRAMTNEKHSSSAQCDRTEE